MNNDSCDSCLQQYKDNTGVMRCRITGKAETQLCKLYHRKQPPQTDQVWVEGGWFCDIPGRGD